MKEKFVPAEMNLVTFVHQDVITTSGGNDLNEEQPLD